MKSYCISECWTINTADFSELERDKLMHISPFSFKSATASESTPAAEGAAVLSGICLTPRKYLRSRHAPAICGTSIGFGRTLIFHITYCSGLLFHIFSSFHI